MNDHVNTFHNGQLAARPRRGSSILDPLLPENRVPTYLRNPHGRVVEVQKWLAVDILNDPSKRGWTEATKEVFTEFEEELQGQELELAQKYVDMMNKPADTDRVAKLESQVSDLTSAVTQLVGLLQPKKTTPNQARKKKNG